MRSYSKTTHPITTGATVVLTDSARAWYATRGPDFVRGVVQHAGEGEVLGRHRSGLVQVKFRVNTVPVTVLELPLCPSDLRNVLDEVDAETRDEAERMRRELDWAGIR